MVGVIETYIPLYRKYRPQAFADVVGQEAIVQTLGNALTQNKIAHAYLLCGPRGTGKTSTARIFAKSINCEQGPTVTPCQTCASCAGITAGNALDVVEFDAASNNGVQDARELIENCQYSSMSGRFKVYIIDEVHMLTNNAFNALLKTLEEPPPNVIFIFATTEAHKVLPTIISRCQRFDFTRITTQNIGDRLRYIAGQENIQINDDAISMIARHARGGMRDAVGLLDQVSVLGRAQADKIIDRADVAMFIGALEEDLLLNLAGAIVEKRAADLLSEISVLAGRGIEPNQLVKDLTMHFRNLLLVKVSGAAADPELLSLPADYYEKLKTQAGLFANEELPLIISRMAGIERNIRHTQQPQLWLEVGLLELAYRQDIDTVDNLARRVSELEAQLAQGGAPAPMAPRPQPVQPAQRPAYQPTQPAMTELLPVSQPVHQEIPQPVPQAVAQAAPQQPVAMSQPAAPPAASGSMDYNYERLIQMVASPPTKSLLKDHTFPLRQEGDLLSIGCSSESILNVLKSQSKLIHLQKAADQFYGRTMRLELVFEKKPASAAPPASPPAPELSLTPQSVSSQPAPQPPVTDQVPEEAPASPPSVSPVAVMEREEPMFAAPPMGPDEEMFAAPPMGPDEDWPDAPSDPAPQAVRPPREMGPEPELDEAKKYTRDLLQGRVLE